MVHKNGNKLFIAFEGKIGYDLNGEFKQTHCILQDITERKQAEEALRKSEAIQAKMVANIGYVIVIIDRDGINRYKSPNIEKWFGWRPEELVGESVWKNVHPGDLDSTQKIFRALLSESNATGTTECRYRCKDGSYKWIEFTVVNLLLDPDIRGLLGNYRDITERKRAEEILRSSEERYRFSLEVTGQIGWSIPPDGLVEDMPLWRQYSGQRMEEVKGWKWLDSLHPDDREHTYKVWVNAIAQKCKYETEYRIRRADGVYRYFMVRGIPLFNADGTVREWVGTCIDITERKQEEQELIEAKERAEESDKLKTAFLNNISHEIRTPFNGILGFLSIIQDSDLTNSERDEYIDLINKSAYRLMNTINNIVEISQIQAGQMKLTASETNIKSLTDELFDHFKTDAESRGLEFTINNDLPDSLDCIFTDRIKLKTILSILIGNAIKFTKEGSIEFGCDLVETRHALSLRFFVKDTGIGISENKQQVIFERFMQADVSNTRQFEGSGIGLSISTAYVKMLGGKIWVESEEGKGSVFYFTIPYIVEPEEKNDVKNVVSAEGAENEVNPEGSGLKILIVEDDQSSAKFVTLIVRKFSKEVLMVSNGLEAVKACRENPDIVLVLMDIQMPEMNGYEATRQIRQFNKEVIIIAQTAFGLTGDREKAMDAGCNDYISKPIKKDEFMELMQKYLKK